MSSSACPRGWGVLSAAGGLITGRQWSSVTRQSSRRVGCTYSAAVSLCVTLYPLPLGQESVLPVANPVTGYCDSDTLSAKRKRIFPNTFGYV